MSARLPGALAAALCALVVAGCGVPAQSAPVATTKSWPAPKPTKAYTVEQLADTVGCAPKFQGKTEDFRQANCKIGKTDYMLLGGITLSNVTRGMTQTATIGYWMGERHAGRGYMSAESISLVLAGPDDHPDKEIKEEVAQLQAA